METRRPTNPAAEEILGLYFPVLDHGFVSLVDYMGSDEDVERAARVSYGYGTRRTNLTRGLIRYLRRHRHTTPSEMVELKFHCAMPIFVARQWIRHRTACLAEGTQVYFDLPGGITRRGNQLYKLPIEALFQRWQPTRNRQRPDKQRNPFFRRGRVSELRVRQMDEQTLQIRSGRIVDVHSNGVKPTIRMLLADGKAIECTVDHRFRFHGGWKTLSEATGLTVRNGLVTWQHGDYYLYVNGTEMVAPALYQDRSWLDAQYNTRSRPIGAIADACGASTHTIRKWLRLHRLTCGHRVVQRAIPWNKGRRYRTGERTMTTAHLDALRRARGGSASNFWKGGVSTDRQSVGRWTTQHAHVVHRRNGWTCQLCHQRAGELHVHHVVPVWADPCRARDETNLTTLCGDCHRETLGRELDYVERLGGPPVRTEWKRRPRVAWNKLTVARLVRIEGFTYAGEKRTFDLEIEGPHHNFVANGIVTHNSVNEMSGRYSLMPLLYHRPDRAQVQAQSPSNRQGRAGAPLDGIYAEAIERWERVRREASTGYEWMVGHDVARELARIDLPLSLYTQWYWKIDLHNLLHFLSLRVDPHAQYEIRAFAVVMAGMLQRVAPLTFEAWVDYDVAGTTLSRGELAAIQRLVRARGRGLEAPGGQVTAEELEQLGLANREVDELLAKLTTPPAVEDFALDLSRARSPEEFAREMEAAVPKVDRR